MRLLTHNLLICNRKQCKGGFPLRIVLSDTPDATRRDDSGQYSPEFTKSVVEKLDWKVFRDAAQSLSMELPLTYTPEDLEDENFLTAVYDAAVNLHILEGELHCPVCERVFPISKGIPNMLLKDNEL